MSGMLEEKTGPRAGTVSAGRTIAVGAAIVMAWRVVFMTVLAQPLGWPDAFMFACALFAVPVHKRFSQPGGSRFVETVTLALLGRLGHGTVAESGSGGAGVVATGAATPAGAVAGDEG